MMRPFIRILSPYEAQHSEFYARQKIHTVQRQNKKGGLCWERKYSNNVKHHHAIRNSILFTFSSLHWSPWLSVLYCLCSLWKIDIILSHYYYQVHSWCRNRLFVAKLPIHWTMKAKHHLLFPLKADWPPWCSRYFWINRCNFNQFEYNIWMKSAFSPTSVFFAIAWVFIHVYRD